MKKLIYLLILVLTGTLAHAQVKIGANPGTISPNSGLEVEATNGNKVIVDKTTGAVSVTGTFAGDPMQITGVKEGQTSAATTLMITADGYIKKAPPAVSLQTRFIASMKQVTGQSFAPAGTTNVDFNAIDFESYPGSVDLTANVIRIPRAGYYQINGTVGLADNNTAGSTLTACIYYLKNATYLGENCLRNFANGNRQSGSFSIVAFLNQGDTISSLIVNANGTYAFTGGTGSLQVIELR